MSDPQIFFEFQMFFLQGAFCDNLNIFIKASDIAVRFLQRFLSALDSRCLQNIVDDLKKIVTGLFQLIEIILRQFSVILVTFHQL